MNRRCHAYTSLPSYDHAFWWIQGKDYLREKNTIQWYCLRLWGAVSNIKQVATIQIKIVKTTMTTRKKILMIRSLCMVDLWLWKMCRTSVLLFVLMLIISSSGQKSSKTSSQARSKKTAELTAASAATPVIRVTSLAQYQYYSERPRKYHLFVLFTTSGTQCEACRCVNWLQGICIRCDSDIAAVI